MKHPRGRIEEPSDATPDQRAALVTANGVLSEAWSHVLGAMGKLDRVGEILRAARIAPPEWLKDVRSELAVATLADHCKQEAEMEREARELLRLDSLARIVRARRRTLDFIAMIDRSCNGETLSGAGFDVRHALDQLQDRLEALADTIARIEDDGDAEGDESAALELRESGDLIAHAIRSARSPGSDLVDVAVELERVAFDLSAARVVPPQTDPPQPS